MFSGPVYKASFSFLGSMLAIAYYNDTEEKVKTVVIREKDGCFLG